MTCYRRLNKKENRSIFFLLFDQSKEKKKAYLVGCKLGFQNLTVGRINMVAAWTGFLMRNMYGRFGRTKTLFLQATFV